MVNIRSQSQQDKGIENGIEDVKMKWRAVHEWAEIMAG